MSGDRFRIRRIDLDADTSVWVPAEPPEEPAHAARRLSRFIGPAVVLGAALLALGAAVALLA